MLFFGLTWLFYELSIGLLFVTTTFRKKFNGIRVFKFYSVLLVIFIFVNPNVPKYLTDGISNNQNPCSLIRPYSEQVTDLRDKILNRTDKTYDIDDIYEIQKYIIDHIKYTYDWINWLLIDYWPTPEEIISKGREDCDGRAILTCSILRSMNFDAYVIVGTDHLWVEVYNCSRDVSILYPRPPALFMFNENNVTYFKTNIEMHYYELFPVYTEVYISDIRTLLLAASAMYAVLFVVFFPTDGKFDGKDVDTKNFRKWAKKHEFFKVSHHYRMLIQSFLTFLVFGLIAKIWPQLSLISLVVVISPNIIAVDRRNKKMANELIKVLLIIGFAILCLENLDVI